MGMTLAHVTPNDVGGGRPSSRVCVGMFDMVSHLCSEIPDLH